MSNTMSMDVLINMLVRPRPHIVWVRDGDKDSGSLVIVRPTGSSQDPKEEYLRAERPDGYDWTTWTFMTELAQKFQSTSEAEAKLAALILSDEVNR